jgi:serine/threonine protein kinase
MCFTERRPDVYLATIPGLTKGTETVCEFHDASLSSPMAFDGKEADSDSSVWLWAFRGKLLIISTPFYRGRHWARTPEEFLPIVEQLKTLHRNDYVHGDIRCCNIIFQDNKQGHLIDFDFGGENNVDTTKYPTGYQGTLFDGTRPGKGGDPVMKRDDWLSLRFVIFDIHNFVPPEHASSVTYEALLQRDQPLIQQLLQENQQLLQRDRQQFQRDRLQREFAEEKAPMAEEIQELVDFLIDIGRNGWKVEPQSHFRKRLEEYGYYMNRSGDMENDCRKGSEAATGSPPKQLVPIVNRK